MGKKKILGAKPNLGPKKGIFFFHFSFGFFPKKNLIFFWEKKPIGELRGVKTGFFWGKNLPEKKKSNFFLGGGGGGGTHLGLVD